MPPRNPRQTSPTGPTTTTTAPKPITIPGIGVVTPSGGTSTTTGTTLPKIVDEAREEYRQTQREAQRAGVIPSAQPTGPTQTTITIPTTTITPSKPINIPGVGTITTTQSAAAKPVKEPEPGGIKGVWKDIMDVTLAPAGRVGKSALVWVLNQPAPMTNPVYSDPDVKVADALVAADTAHRIVVSAVKEASDAVNGGDASWAEFLNQVQQDDFGVGKAFPNPPGPKWLDRTGAFVGDIVLSPENWVLPASSVVKDITLDAATKITIKEASEIVAKEGADIAARGTVKNVSKQLIDDFVEAQDLVNAFDAARKGVDDFEGAFTAGTFADQAATTQARDAAYGALANAQDEIARVTGKVVDDIGQAEAAAFKNLREKAVAVVAPRGTRGSRLAAAISAHDAALENLAIATNSGIASEIRTASRALAKATDDLGSATLPNWRLPGQGVSRYGAKRTRGFAGREELAERVRQVRMKAEDTIANPGNYTPGQVETAKYMVELLSDEQIARIAVNGYFEIKGPLAQALGVTNKLRTTRLNPFTLFQPKLIGGTDKLSYAISPGRMAASVAGGGGGLLGWTRRTPLGQRVLDMITPLGRKTIIGDADLIAMRTELRSGAKLADAYKLKDEAARLAKIAEVSAEYKQYIQTIAFAKVYPIVLASRRRVVGSAIKKLFVTPRGKLRGTEADWEVVRAILTGNPPANVTALQQQLADESRQLLDLFVEEAAQGAGKYGAQIDRLPNYFPRMQSDKAIEWIIKQRPLAELVAKSLNADVDFLANNFLDRVLVKGSKWFDVVLDGTETPERLNQIAREARGYNINFDFFETNTKKVISKYADTHARYMAYIDTIDQMLDPITGARDVLQAATTKNLTKKIKELTTEDTVDITRELRGIDDNVIGYEVVNRVPFEVNRAIDDLQTALQGAFLQRRRRGGIPEAKAAGMAAEDVATSLVGDAAQLWTRDLVNDIFASIDSVRNRLVNAANTGANPLYVDEIVKQLDDITTRINNINQALRSGAVQAPKTGMVTALELQDLLTNINLVYPGGVIPTGSAALKDIDLLKHFETLGPDRWRKIVRNFDSAFQGMGLDQLPDVAAAREVRDMFGNVKRLDNSSFARNAERLLGDYNKFFKAYATARPGFHFRNAMSNTMALIAAGISPTNGIEAIRYYQEYWDAMKLRAVRNLPSQTPAEWLATKGLAPTQRRILEDAWSTIDQSGQFAEIFGTGLAGQRVGPSGQVIEAGLPARVVSRVTRREAEKPILAGTRAVAGAPLAASRGLGNAIENSFRFALAYDGLVKGLNPVEAVGRVNKYMFDYQDLSRLDRALHPFVPFWIWTSRNFPLQIENALTNPRLYANYGHVRRNLEREQDPNDPIGGLTKAQVRAGVFVIDPSIPIIGGMEFYPDFGFPGYLGYEKMGRPSQIDWLVQLPLLLASEDYDGMREVLREWMNSSTPAIKTPIEFAAAYSFFKDKGVIKTGSPMSAGEQAWNYFLSQVFQPAAAYGNLAESTRSLPGPNLPLPKDPGWMTIFGVTQPYTKGMTDAEIDAIAEASARRSLETYFGLPFRTPNPSSQAYAYTEAKKALEELLRLEELKDK